MKRKKHSVQSVVGQTKKHLNSYCVQQKVILKVFSISYHIHVTELNIDGLWKVKYVHSHLNPQDLIIKKITCCVDLLSVKHCYEWTDEKTAGSEGTSSYLSYFI